MAGPQTMPRVCILDIPNSQSERQVEPLAWQINHDQRSLSWAISSKTVGSLAITPCHVREQNGPVNLNTLAFYVHRVDE